jgi:release factor glutamine methyltransferase
MALTELLPYGQMLSIAETLKKGESILAEHKVAEPRRDAVTLLAFVTDRDRVFFYAHPEHEISVSEHQKFHELLNRRANHEPLQYITGRQEFFRLDFEVTTAVLIPRPETEMIVENAIELLRHGGNVCEVGIGSGCIAISILVNRPDATAVGLDVSPEALAVALRNAEKHRVADRLRLLNSDVFSALSPDSEFDMIVSNPPYVPAADIEGLPPEVRDFEPHAALTDGRDGTSIIRRIINQARDLLRPGGVLLMEIGFDQSVAVAEIFPRYIWDTIEFLADLQGIPRMVRARRR